MTTRRRSILNAHHGHAATAELLARYDRLGALVARTTTARRRARLIEEVRFLAELIEARRQ